MTACILYDLARVTVAAAPGLGPITLGPAVTSFRTFAEAGVQNGQAVRYSVRDGSQREVGRGTYSSTGPTLTRAVRSSTNANQLINLSVNAVVAIVESSEDILSFAVDQTGLFTDPERTIARNNLGAVDVTALNAKVAKAGDTMTGALTVADATASTSASTGALVVAGGVGVGGALYGTTFDFKTGTDRHLSVRDFSGRAQLFSATDGAVAYNALLIDAVPLALNTNSGQNVDIGAATAGMVSIAFNTASTSPTTGALTVAGGLGVNGVISGNGAVHFGGPTIASPNNSTHSLYYNSSAKNGVEIIGTANSVAGAALMAFVNNSVTTLGAISIAGAAPGTGVTYNTTSDGRLKEDLRDFTNAGDLIDRLKIWDFRWKSTGERGVGVVAQEAVEVFPDAVAVPRDDAMSYGVDYSRFVPLLIAEIQTLRRRIEALEKRGK